MSEGTRSSAIARRRKPLPPTTSSGPSTSSSERGRIRSASGVSDGGRASGIGFGPRRSKRSVKRPRAGGGSLRSRPRPARRPAVPSPPGADRTRRRKSDRAPSRPLAAAPPWARGGPATATARSEGLEERRAPQREARERGPRAPSSGRARTHVVDLLLQPVEVRDSRVAPLQLLERALRGGGVANIERVDEDEVQERLPMVRIGGAGLREERDGALELPAVAIGRAEVRKDRRILGCLPQRLFVGPDRAGPVFAVVKEVSERRPESRVLGIALERASELGFPVSARRTLRSLPRTRRPPAASREVPRDETEERTDRERQDRGLARGGDAGHGDSSRSSSRAAFHLPDPASP